MQPLTHGFVTCLEAFDDREWQAVLERDRSLRVAEEGALALYEVASTRVLSAAARALRGSPESLARGGWAAGVVVQALAVWRSLPAAKLEELYAPFDRLASLADLGVTPIQHPEPRVESLLAEPVARLAPRAEAAADDFWASVVESVAARLAAGAIPADPVARIDTAFLAGAVEAERRLGIEPGEDPRRPLLWAAFRTLPGRTSKPANFAYAYAPFALAVPPDTLQPLPAAPDPGPAEELAAALAALPGPRWRTLAEELAAADQGAIKAAMQRFSAEHGDAIAAGAAATERVCFAATSAMAHLPRGRAKSVVKSAARAAAALAVRQVAAAADVDAVYGAFAALTPIGV